jgi:hypothetical protein
MVTEQSTGTDYVAQYKHHRAEALKQERYAAEASDSTWANTAAGLGQVHATLALAAASMLNAQHNAPIVTTIAIDDLTRGA